MKPIAELAGTRVLLTRLVVPVSAKHCKQILKIAVIAELYALMDTLNTTSVVLAHVYC